MLSQHPIKKEKRKGTCNSDTTGTALVILMLETTASVRCTAGESVSSRSQAHLQPRSAQQTWGSKLNTKEAEEHRAWLPGCSSLLLTPTPVFHWCAQVQRLLCLSWPGFRATSSVQETRKCDLVSGGSSRCKKIEEQRVRRTWEAKSENEGLAPGDSKGCRYLCLSEFFHGSSNC